MLSASCNRKDLNQMFLPSFARGPWQETFKTAFSGYPDLDAGLNISWCLGVVTFETNEAPKLNPIVVRLSDMSYFGWGQKANLTLDWY